MELFLAPVLRTGDANRRRLFWDTRDVGRRGRGLVRGCGSKMKGLLRFLGLKKIIFFMFWMEIKKCSFQKMRLCLDGFGDRVARNM